MSAPRRSRTWLWLFVLAALAGWLMAPSQQPGRALVMPRRDAWKLPALPPRPDDNDAVVLAATAPFWGAVESKAVAASGAVVEDRRWRIAGIFGEASRRGVLVTFAAPDRPPQRLFAGDKLPSGDRIVSVGERELCVRLGRRSYRLGVERIEP